MIKANIQTTGDPSVGIFPDEINLEWNIVLGTKEEREKFRKDLKDMFQEFCDSGTTYVIFEDECGDCGALLPKVDGKYGQCINPKCPQNYDKEIQKEREQEQARLEKRAKQLRKTVAYKRYEEWRAFLQATPSVPATPSVFQILLKLHEELDKHFAYGSTHNADVAYEALEQFIKDYKKVV